MNAIRVETTVDEVTAQAIPALRPLLGKRVELIALHTEGAPTDAPQRKHSFEELLARRVKAPAGSLPLSDDDIKQAIIAGALDGNT